MLCILIRSEKISNDYYLFKFVFSAVISVSHFERTNSQIRKPSYIRLEIGLRIRLRIGLRIRLRIGLRIMLGKRLRIRLGKRLGKGLGIGLGKRYKVRKKV